MTKNNVDPSKLIKFLRDTPEYFIENYLKIRPKGEPLSPFILNPSQKIVVQKVTELIKENKPIRLIIVKNRQVGMSTLTEALTFWSTITNPSYHSLLVAPDREKAQELFGISQTFYDGLPDWLKPLKLYRTKNNLIFEQPNEKLRKTQPGLGSSMTITPANNLTSPRGKALSAAHLSEVPYYDIYMEDLFPALANAIPYRARTLIILESTPMGRGGYFYDTYMAAKKGENGFTPIFLPWTIDPSCSWTYPIPQEEEHAIMRTLDSEEKVLVEKFACNIKQLKWRRHNIAEKCNGNVDKFHFENPLTEEEAFELSGAHMFSIDARKHYIEKITSGKKGFLFYGGNPYIEHPIIKFKESLDESAPLKIFHKPVRNEEYSMGVDPAYGKGQDYSAIVILDKKLRVCATFYDNTIPIDEFTDEVVKIGKYYNTAKLALETTGPGNGMMYRLRKMYTNWWIWEKWDAPSKRVKLRSIGFDATNRSVSAIDNLTTWAINAKVLELNCADLTNEMLVFQYDANRDRGAAPWGDHDDLMRALGLALLAIEQLGIVAYAPEEPEQKSILPPGAIDDLSLDGDDFFHEAF